MKKDPAQFQFSFDATVTPRGDGTFIVSPGKPILGRRELTVAEAAKKTGLSEDTIHRLLNAGFLEGRNPSPRRTFIFADSLEAHLEKTKDREFWEDKSRLQTYLDVINPR